MSHAHKHVAPSITPKRWQYLKGLGLNDGRYIHISARRTADRRDPLRARGVTYNVGSNAAKRERRSSQRARGVA